MTTMYHPTIPGVTTEVADSQVDAWSEQGWTKSETKKVREAEQPDPPVDPAQAVEQVEHDPEPKGRRRK